MTDLSPAAAITPARLRLFAPNCDYQALAAPLDRAAREFGITTPRQVRHWLAQLHHESGGFQTLEEGLSYSADRLCAVWPSRFPTRESAEPYARNPQALANKVYGGRLGNTAEGDGWRFRGRGLIQITGRSNYSATSSRIGLDLIAQPELAARPDVAARVAAEWWSRNGLNAIVAPDAGERPMANVEAALAANELDDVREARRRINGGLTGLDDAERQLMRAGTIWRDAA